MKPVICPRAREQGFASVLEFFADATHSAMFQVHFAPFPYLRVQQVLKWLIM
jgi:hypothetical protein